MAKMVVITKRRLEYEIESRRRFLKALEKERSEQKKKLQEVQKQEEIKEQYVIDLKLSDIEMGVKEEIISIKELLVLGEEKITVEYK